MPDNGCTFQYYPSLDFLRDAHLLLPFDRNTARCINHPNQMKKLLTLLLFVGVVYSCSNSNIEQQNSEIDFTAHQFTYKDLTLPYRKGEVGVGNNRILILYLHGGSSKGDDNLSQLGEPAIFTIAKYLQNNNIVADIIVPQCPTDKSWGKSLNNALKTLIEQFNYTKLYLFGGSMGGTGIWEFISAYPALVTAAMPVAGNPSICNANNIAQSAIYTVVGSEDKQSTIDAVTEFVAQLQILGANIRFDIENGWGHAQSCTDSYTDARLSWVFGF